MRTLFEEKGISSCQEAFKILFLGVLRYCEDMRTRHERPHSETNDPDVPRGGGGGVIRLGLCRRLVNVLAIAERTGTLVRG